MATGDLITGEWQMERDGLLVGDGTDYDIRQITGLASLPGIKTQDRPLTLRNGSVAGSDYLGVRVFVVDFEIVTDTTTMTAKIDALSDAWTPSTTESVLAFQLPGVAAGVVAQVTGRVRRRGIPINLEFSRGVASVAVEVHCSDPLIYSQTENTATAGLATAGGGLTFNASPNFTFGAVSTGGLVSPTNAGTYSAPPVFRIDGPVDNPIIEHQSNGGFLSFNISLGSNDFLIVDTKARTVKLQGTASRYSSMTTASTWFGLDAGANEIRFRADAYDADALLTVTWRDAWA